MTFQAALTAMQAGHRVRRAEWTSQDLSIVQGEFFAGVDEDRRDLKYMVFTFRSVDILATDWELVEP